MDHVFDRTARRKDQNPRVTFADKRCQIADQNCLFVLSLLELEGLDRGLGVSSPVALAFEPGAAPASICRQSD